MTAPQTVAAPPRAELSGISKRFAATQALDDVSLDLLPGEVHALVGENGAGKSTLVKIMAGVHQPDSGAIRLDARTDALGDASLAVGSRFKSRGVRAAHAGRARLTRKILPGCTGGISI